MAVLKKIGVFYNPKKDEVKGIFSDIEKWGKANNISITIFHQIPASVPKIDLAVVFGGDGTMLRIGRFIAGSNVPMLGVNLGTLGFLAEVNKKEMLGDLGNLKKEKKWNIQKRLLLDVLVKRNGKTLKKYIAVNDVVVKNGDKVRVIDLDVWVDNKIVATYTGDGVIVATPTGSTAYSLAAGGPIIHPSLPLIVISAICPHTLTLRPLIVGADKNISINNLKISQDSILSIDGQITQKLFTGDEIHIKRSKNQLCLLIADKRNYFEVLREKLSWGVRKQC
ncbi:MAG: NAD(+)/NADH kinase [Elusimicrobiota bacterium]